MDSDTQVKQCHHSLTFWTFVFSMFYKNVLYVHRSVVDALTSRYVHKKAGRGKFSSITLPVHPRKDLPVLPPFTGNWDYRCEQVPSLFVTHLAETKSQSWPHYPTIYLSSFLF